jgi:hypothetical protein
MKKFYKSTVVILLFTIILSTFCISAKAAPINPGITLDGNFTDWDGKPAVSDVKHDVKNTKNDFINTKYIADNNYLYLYVERLAASKNAPWHFEVVIPNGVCGQNKNIDLFNKGKLSFVPVFDVTVSFEKSLTLVTVSCNEQSIESTLSSSANGKIIEFRIPLDKVGLRGFNKEIQFTLLSDSDEGDNADWLPDAYPITLTTGPTGAIITSILFFLGVSFLVYSVKGKVGN